MTPEGGCGGPVQEVNLGEEEQIEDAIFTAYGHIGERWPQYKNNECQEWKVIAAPSQVKVGLFV